MTGTDLAAFLVPLPPTLHKKNKNSPAVGKWPCCLQEAKPLIGLLAFRRVLPLQCEPLLTKENPSEAEGVMQTSHIALLPLFFGHFLELIERRDGRQQLSFATTIIFSHEGHSLSYWFVVVDDVLKIGVSFLENTNSFGHWNHFGMPVVSTCVTHSWSFNIEGILVESVH